MEYFSDDHKDRPNQHENNHKLCNKKGASTFGHPLLGIHFWVWRKVDGNWDNNNPNFPMGGKQLQKKNTRLKERNKSKKVRLYEYQSKNRAGQQSILVRWYKADIL